MNSYFGIKIEYRYIVAAIYTVVLFLDRLDLTIVNIALPTLATFFKIPITQTEWINNAYLLALTISIPLSAWAGERFGCKKMFVLATGIFGLSSFLCAFSPNLICMAVLRFLQGLGGGVIIPVGMSMVYRVFQPAEYASITSFIFIPTLIAPAIAPALGGIMIHYFGWPWVFLFAVPLCALAIILSIIIIKEQEHKSTTPLDWQGFLLSSCALSSILYFISSLGKNESYIQTFGVCLVALFLSFLFVRCEKKSPHPLIEIHFFKNKLFVQANLIQLTFQICHFGSIFLIGMYFQVGVGMSAMTAGLIMGMQAIGAICMSRYSVKLFHQFGPGRPLIIGFVGIAILTPCILLIHTPHMIFAGGAILFIRGLFSGLCGTPIQTASIIGFKKEDVGRASAVFNAGRQISISLGIALTSLLITYGLQAHASETLTLSIKPQPAVFYYAFMLIPVVSFFGILISMRINNKQIMELGSIQP